MCKNCNELFLSILRPFYRIFYCTPKGKYNNALFSICTCGYRVSGHSNKSFVYFCFIYMRVYVNVNRYDGNYNCFN